MRKGRVSLSDEHSPIADLEHPFALSLSIRKVVRSITRQVPNMLHGIQKMNKPLSFNIPPKRPRTRMRRLLEPGYRLLTALVAAVLTFLLSPWLPDLGSRIVLAWDVAVAILLALIAIMMWGTAAPRDSQASTERGNQQHRHFVGDGPGRCWGPCGHRLRPAKDQKHVPGAAHFRHL